MSRQIEQALLSLIPTYGSDLPPALVELADSLLAQSRHRASTLKADEEVARLYACANLACDRLKVNLDLPPIQVRPPIPPRIYNRLYAHLENVIPSASSTPRRTRAARTQTPNSKQRVGGADEQRPLPSRKTPTKEQSLAQFRNTTTPSCSAARNGFADLGNGLPSWVKPVIRFFCSETHQSQFASTVLAGMDTIVAPGGRRTGDAWINQNITSLLAAIYFYVVIKVVALTTGQEMTREPFAAQRREILKLLTRARDELTINVTGAQDPWEDWQDVKARDFNSAVNQLEEQGWLEDDWFKGIEDVVKPKKWDAAPLPTADEDDDMMMKPIQVRRADTMFQEKYDYLSETKKADFKTWQLNILQQISDLKSMSNAMEVDS